MQKPIKRIEKEIKKLLKENNRLKELGHLNQYQNNCCIINGLSRAKTILTKYEAYQ